jgi:uncharacterized protein
MNATITDNSPLLTLFEGEYALVSLSPGETNLAQLPLFPANPQSVLVVVHDPVEITLVLPLAVWSQHSAHFPQASVQTGYRAIRLSQSFPLETVGILKKLTTALSDAQISLMAYSTYRSDVLLVREQDVSNALGQLWNLRFDD